MSGRVKLTPAGAKFLNELAEGRAIRRWDNPTARKLQAQGFAKRLQQSLPSAFNSYWEITPSGREALAAHAAQSRNGGAG